jgi:hypothetical protein
VELVKDALAGPNPDIERIIRSVRNNNWLLSNKLRKDSPMIATLGIEEDLIAAVKNAFIDETPGNRVVHH